MYPVRVIINGKDYKNSKEVVILFENDEQSIDLMNRGLLNEVISMRFPGYIVNNTMSKVIDWSSVKGLVMIDLT